LIVHIVLIDQVADTIGLVVENDWAVRTLVVDLENLLRVGDRVPIFS